MLHLAVSPSHPAILLLALTTAGNGVRRQASAGGEEEEAGKLMIPHQGSDKRRDIFPPQKQQKKTHSTTATCVADYLPTLSLPSLLPSCVLNALLPSPWKWAFILLVEKGKNSQGSVHSTGAEKNRNSRRAAGRHSVYREHKHYAGLIIITISTKHFYFEKQNT